MSELRVLVLDVLKPYDPSAIDLCRRIADLRGVVGVNCVLDEADDVTESVKLTIVGEAIDFDGVGNVIAVCGAVIHSIDSVLFGVMLPRETRTKMVKRQGADDQQMREAYAVYIRPTVMQKIRRMQEGIFGKSNIPPGNR